MIKINKFFAGEFPNERDLRNLIILFIIIKNDLHEKIWSSDNEIIEY